MRKMLVDTSAWDAIADSGDPNHKAALAFKGDLGPSQLVVTNYILDELFTLLLLNIGHQRTVDFKHNLDLLIEEGVLQVFWVTPELAAKAWAVFEQYNADKQWSFTDCVSYVVMKQLEIIEAFAFDHHFEQMGMIRLPSANL